MDWKFKYTELGPPVPPRSEWPERVRQDSMTEKTEIKAGNTTQTLKPKEVSFLNVPATTTIKVSNEIDAPQNSELNSPDIDECAPIIAGHVNEDFQLPESGSTYGNISPEILGVAKDLNRNIVNSLRSDLDFPPLSEQEHSDLYKSSAQLEEEPEVIPATNIWALRMRVSDLEERVGQLEDKIARHNVNSAWKIL